ncbi:proteasome activator [Actinomycetospora soli]|uniref:proteasome activator n=1 Tax=Actinomycetospora soli TaxID=2893887 RepID=UPI0035569FCD
MMDAVSTEAGEGAEGAEDRPANPSALAAAAASGAGDGAGTAELVESPGAVMRVAGMVGKLIEEVRSAPLDEAGRARLADIHARSIQELGQGLAPELRDELARISLPLGTDEVPSQAELRIAQAQLLGWLEGLFHGIQSAVLAQQMAARGQLEQMRQGRPGRTGTALPGGSAPAEGGQFGGQYL